MRGGNQDKRLQLNENRIRQHHHEAHQFRTESKQFSEKERETEHQKRITNMTRTEWERAWTAKREKEKGKSELGTVEAPSQPASSQTSSIQPAGWRECLERKERASSSKSVSVNAKSSILLLRVLLTHFLTFSLPNLNPVHTA